MGTSRVTVKMAGQETHLAGRVGLISCAGSCVDGALGFESEPARAGSACCVSCGVLCVARAELVDKCGYVCGGERLASSQLCTDGNSPDVQ